MTELLKLGAIDKLTNKYVYPKIANKNNDYLCPDCNKELILCHGDIRIPYFRHKIDNINPCNYYLKPSESQIHKDAKLLLKTLLENKSNISIIRKCISCDNKDKYKIPEFDETSQIILEYKLEYNGLKIADAAFIDNNDLICIFEIYNTHKTENLSRPDPWFEIDAQKFIKLVNDNNNDNLIIPCIRSTMCNKCEYKKKGRKSLNNILYGGKPRTIKDNKIKHILKNNEDKIIKLKKIIKSDDDDFYIRIYYTL